MKSIDLEKSLFYFKLLASLAIGEYVYQLNLGEEEHNKLSSKLMAPYRHEEDKRVLYDVIQKYERKTSTLKNFK